MDAFIVRGGRRLSGSVQVGGAKNSALKLLAAALLARGRSTVHNVPAIGDMAAMDDVLGHLGARVERPDANTFVVEVGDEIGVETPADAARRLRASVIVLGPVLARCGRARLATPGGCDLGSRNIDMHLDGLTQMGAEITIGADFIEARADRLTGADIELPYASVGATENLMLAAVTAVGTTRIRNAAREPEIADLAAFLVTMGASITGAGTSDLTIRGVTELAAAEHRVVGDRIEAGTFAVAAVISGGRVDIDGVDPSHLRLVLDKLAAVGAAVESRADGLTVAAPERLRAVDVATLPYPGFPTDLQPQFLALLSQAAGTSMLTENVYEARFKIIEELRRLGAEIDVEGHHALVRGPRPLRGGLVRAPDLRAGAALVVAGLVADGATVVTDPAHIDRGYADFAGKLDSLGADVRRTSVEIGSGAPGRVAASVA